MLEIARTITPGWQDPMRRNEVCYGSAAEIPRASSEVRFTPEADMDRHGRGFCFVPEADIPPLLYFIPVPGPARHWRMTRRGFAHRKWQAGVRVVARGVARAHRATCRQ